MSEGRIYFLDFTFNPFVRTLQQNEKVIQLRKKQSDVLTLLCKKYPDPVSQDEFLMEVWEGGYVTSQSIAQMIRSLRIILGDESKSTIVTIPKLGYQFTVEPVWEALQSEPKLPVDDVDDVDDVEDSLAKEVELNNIPFSTPSAFMLKPPSLMRTAITSHSKAGLSVGGRFPPKMWFFSAVAVLFCSLYFMTMSAKSDPLPLPEETNTLFYHHKMDSASILDEFFLYFCRHTVGSIVCRNKVFALATCIGKDFNK
nr:winged helix-turn-helix domain-containing protein [Klebsiella aerogenes]